LGWGCSGGVRMYACMWGGGDICALTCARIGEALVAVRSRALSLRTEDWCGDDE
jgi:hypothetical protein